MGKSGRKYREREREWHRPKGKAYVPLCSKTGFKSHEAALTRAGEIACSNNRAPIMRAYRCPKCDLYHLTSQPARESI